MKLNTASVASSPSRMEQWPPPCQEVVSDSCTTAGDASYGESSVAASADLSPLPKR